MANSSSYLILFIWLPPILEGCLPTKKSGIPAISNCPSCDVSTLSGTSFTPTTTTTPGAAYFLRGVDPTNWCDVAQINCLTEDGSSSTIQAYVVVGTTRTVVASGCGQANSVQNALLCNSNNQWTYGGQTDFSVECVTVVGSTC